MALPRTGILLACLLALADPSVPRQVDAVHRVLVLDLSRSYQGRMEEAREGMQGIVEAMDPTDLAAIVIFAERAGIAVPFRHPRDIFPLPDLHPPGHPDVSDPGAGIRLALEMDPSVPTTEIVLFTDGRETAGDAIAEAARARARGIPVRVVEVGKDSPRDLRVDDLLLPPSVAPGEPFLVEVVVSGRGAREGEVRLSRPGVPDRVRWMVLADGIPAILRFQDEVTAPGIVRYEASIDGILREANRENNRIQGHLRCGEDARVLALTRSPARVAPLGGLEGVDLIVPGEGADLHRGDLIIIDNLRRDEIGDARMEEIVAAVRDGGTGLLVLGGRRSFGPGGYPGTSLDAILPVASDPEEDRTKELSLAVVLDASGSMGEEVDGDLKFRQAVRAILPVGGLGNRDRLEVVIFRNDPEVAVPLGPVESQAEIRASLMDVRPGGGTRLLPALEKAAADLAGETGRARHIIVLSDGRSDEDRGEWVRWEEICAARGDLTTSVIAIGRSPDEDRLRWVAETGGGSFYGVHGVSDALGEIFGNEVRVARGSLLREGPTPVESTGAGPVSGLDGIPSLQGHVVTAPRDGSTVFLRSGPYPILAGWRAGLGRVLVFTSSLDTDWGRDWREWPGLAPFLSQAVRWTARPSAIRGMSVRCRREGREVLVEVEGPEGSPLSLRLQVGEKGVFPLRRIGAHRFRARIPAPRPGGPPVILLEETDDGCRPLGVVTRDVGAVAEMRDLSMNSALLERIASGSPGPPTLRDDRRPLWPHLLVAALLLLLLELILSARLPRPLDASRQGAYG